MRLCAVNTTISQQRYLEIIRQLHHIAEAPTNCSVLSQVVGWQLPFVENLVVLCAQLADNPFDASSAEERPSQQQAGSGNGLTVAMDQTITLMAKIVLARLATKGGWHSLEVTMALLYGEVRKQAGSGGEAMAPLLRSALCLAVLRGCERHWEMLPARARNSPPAVWALNMVHVLMLAEERLYCDQPMQPGWAEEEAQVTLMAAFQSLVAALGIAFESSFGILDGGLTSGSDARVVRPLGMARISLRLALDELRSTDLEVATAAAAALRVHVLSPRGTCINVFRAAYILWHIDLALHAHNIVRWDADDALHSRLCSVAAHLLREHWAEFRFAGGPPLEPAAITGPTDAIFLPSGYGRLVAALRSPWWQHQLDQNVGPRSFSVMEAEWVDRGTNALHASERADATAEHIAGLLSERTATLRTSASFLRGLVLDPLADRSGHEWQRQRRLSVSRSTRHAACMRAWARLQQFLLGPRGILEDGVPAADKEAKQWKLDRTESFSRMHLKLAPNYDFDLHTDASEARDNSSGATRTPVKRLPEGLSRRLRGASASSLAPEAAPAAAAIPLRGTGAEAEADALIDGEGEALAAAAEEEEEEGGRTLFTTPCRLVLYMEATPGTLVLTQTHVMFTADPAPNSDGGARRRARIAVLDDVPLDFCWQVQALREVHMRRYNLRPHALELFLVDQTNVFLTFERGVREGVYDAIVKLQPRNMVHTGPAPRSPAARLEASGLTERWRRRQITNFDYLMQLNTIAGRTYNDLNQYPVFPWVLSDYTSATLDLENPAVYAFAAVAPLCLTSPTSQLGHQEL